MQSVFYVLQSELERTEGWLRYSDLLPKRQPAFVLPDPGSLLVGIQPGARLYEADSHWLAHSLKVVLELDFTGDSIGMHFSDPTPSELVRVGPVRLVRQDLLRDFHWIPCPTDFPQPLPRALWSFIISGARANEGAA